MKRAKDLNASHIPGIIVAAVPGVVIRRSQERDTGVAAGIGRDQDPSTEHQLRDSAFRLFNNYGSAPTGKPRFFRRRHVGEKIIGKFWFLTIENPPDGFQILS
jgi:hypothetical protein